MSKTAKYSDAGSTNRLELFLIAVLAAASLGFVAFWIVNLGELTREFIRPVMPSLFRFQGAPVSFAPAQQTGGRKIEAPRFWNDRELSDWATPVAGINVRPGHYSEKEYYAAPELELVRTYPVYAPGREPAGYWQMLQNAKPERLLTPGTRTEGEWIAEGKRVFHELDALIFRRLRSEAHRNLPFVKRFSKARRSCVERWHGWRRALGADLERSRSLHSGVCRLS